MEDVAPRRRSAAAAWLPPLAWGAALLLLSAQPSGRFPAAGIPHLDKLVHGALYTILGALAGRALALRARPRRAVLAAAAVALVGFGALDEWSQGFSPGRTTSLADLAADAIGAWIGLLATSRYYGRRHGIPAQLPRR